MSEQMPYTAAVLFEALTKHNTAYRAGLPNISDEEYDRLVEALRDIQPDHPYLAKPEPEPDFGIGKVVHPSPMLSTEKAYTEAEIVAWFDRVSAEAAEIGMSEGSVMLRLTPKLDGVAGRYDGRVLSTRGDGLRGNDITHLLQAGLKAHPGLGELVVNTDYFNDKLSEHFEHPRNFVSGLVGSKTLNMLAANALSDGAVYLANYDALEQWGDSLTGMRANYSAAMEKAAMNCPCLIDGWVLSILNQKLQVHMGATSHHHRWMLAIKVKGDTAETTVNNIVWQTGRTGQVTPVLEVDPVYLSGATLSRVTAHHAGMVAKLGIGPGATIKLIRSGEVIPKIEEVVQRAPVGYNLPHTCPSCASPLEWDGDFLMCRAKGCPAKVEAGLLHFFKTMGNVDLFGPATIKTMVANGRRFIHTIFALDLAALESMGITGKSAQNLLDELERCRTEPVEDWRFLAAMGIESLGKGASRSLLQYIMLDDLNRATVEQLEQVPGIGKLTAQSIFDGLQGMQMELWLLGIVGFNLIPTKLRYEQAGTPCGALAGVSIVFTGSMKLGIREEMEAQARALGATVQSAVSAKTTVLVCGDKAGSKKAKAEKLGILIRTEQEYLDWLDPTGDEKEYG